MRRCSRYFVFTIMARSPFAPTAPANSPMTSSHSRKLLGLGLLSLCLATAPAYAQLKVLFLGSYSQPGLDNTFADIMTGDARFDLGNSSTFAWADGDLPSLATLNQYDAVLAWTDFSYSTSMSDLLADYVDAGGGVVLSTFWGQEVHSILGGGRLETTGYNPLINSQFDAFSSAILGTYDAASPLFSGVSSLSASFYRGDYLPGLDVGATLVASWSDGNPLLAFNASADIVNLTLNPAAVELGHVTGDYAQLFRNSLAFVAQGGSPAVPEPSTYALFGSVIIGVLAIRRSRRQR